MEFILVNLDLKKLILTVAVVTLLAACQPKEKEDVAKESKPEVSSNVAVKEGDQIGYALGAKMATFIRTDVEKYDMPTINMEAIADGFKDGLNDKSKMTEEEITAKFMEFQQLIQAAQQQQAAIQKEKDAELAKVAIAEADAFLAENGKKEGVTTTESGLQYSVLKAGDEGAVKPLATDTVEVHYHGTFTDGKVFDSSVDRGKTVAFPLNQVIKGWTEGLQLMSIGSKYHFVIPWELAYGAQGRPGAIPGHSVLQFEVELVAINPKAEEAKTDEK